MTISYAIDSGQARQLCTFYWGTPKSFLDIHPALSSSSVCLSTCTTTVKDIDGKEIVFLPGIQDIISVNRGLSRIDARAEISSVDFEVYGSGLHHKFFTDSGGSGWRVRIDIGYEGCQISNLYPIFDGYITDIDIKPRSRFAASIRAVEGPGNIDIEFPGALFQYDEFPNAPNWVIGSLARTIVLGPVPEMLMCVPISRDATVYYVCEPPLTSHPRAVFVGNTETDQYRLVTMRTARSGTEFSAIVFPKPAQDMTSEFSSNVSVSGGSGITYTDPISFLCDYAGIPMTGRARAIARSFSLDFPLSIMVNEKSSVLDLIMSRIMRQTPYIATFFLSMLDIISLDGFFPIAHLENGVGLRGLSDPSRATSTPFGSVVNAVEVRAGMNHYGNGTSSLPVLRVFYDNQNGPPEITAIAAASQATYGRRFLSVDAGDLYVYVDRSGQPVRSISAEKLAAFIIRSRAFQAIRYSYLVKPSIWLRMRLGDNYILSDKTLGLDKANVILTGKQISKEGLICEFEKIIY